jgi:hypothetical protein
VLEISGEINDRHPAGAELTLDVVAAGEPATEVVDRIRSWRRGNSHRVPE